MDLDAQARAWLYRNARRVASDACLGVVLLIAGAVAIWAAGDFGLGTASHLGAGVYPRVLGWLLLVIGIVALLRAAVLRNVDHARWSLSGVAWITAIVLAAAFAPAEWIQRFGPPDWLLRFGPADFLAMMLLALALAIML